MNTSDLRRGITQRKKIAAVAETMRIQSVRAQIAAIRNAGNGKPYVETLQTIVAGTALLTATTDNLFINPPPTPSRLVVLVTPDKGFCGKQNRTLEEMLLRRYPVSQGHTIAIVGNAKPKRFTGHGYALIADYAGRPLREAILPAADAVLARYLAGGWGGIDIVWASPAGTGYVVEFRTIVPFRPPEGKAVIRFETEPSPEEMLGLLFPEYLRSQVQFAVSESQIAMYGERIQTLTQIADNAKKLAERMTRNYQKARQAAITNDLPA